MDAAEMEAACMTKQNHEGCVEVGHRVCQTVLVGVNTATLVLNIGKDRYYVVRASASIKAARARFARDALSTAQTRFPI